MTITYQPRYIGKSTPTRRIVTGRRDCFTGDQQSTKPAMEYRRVNWEGLLARDCLYLLNIDQSVVLYQEEPPPILWYDGIRRRRYHPDFAVTYDDGRVICLEVKPEHLVQQTRFRDKLPLIAIALKMAGYTDAWLWTEEEIRVGATLANAQLIHGEFTSPTTDETALHTMRMTLHKKRGHAKMRDLRIASGLGNRSFRTVVRLIGLQEFDYVERHREIDDNTTIIFSDIGGGRAQ